MKVADNPAAYYKDVSNVDLVVIAIFGRPS